MRRTYWTIENESEMLTKSQAKKNARSIADMTGDTVTITLFKMDKYGIFWDEETEIVYPTKS